MLDTTGGEACNDEDLASEYSSGSFWLDAKEATRWWRLVFKLKTTLKTSVVQSRFCKSTTLLNEQVTWTPLGGPLAPA